MDIQDKPKSDERQMGCDLASIETLHMWRYMWAAIRTKGNHILDCACGTGYGSYILALASHHAHITSLDNLVRLYLHR